MVNKSLLTTGPKQIQPKAKGLKLKAKGKEPGTRNLKLRTKN
jgi:hypothetical protein